MDPNIKPVLKINIMGQEVEVVKWKTKLHKTIYIYSAYVTIKNSRFLNAKTVGSHNYTYRKGDELGVDSNRSFLNRKSNEHKLISILNEIQHIISDCISVLEKEGEINE